jgi:hypothetical protein
MNVSKSLHNVEYSADYRVDNSKHHPHHCTSRMLLALLRVRVKIMGLIIIRTD